MTTPFRLSVGLLVKPAGPGHNAPHMTCHHWAYHGLTCAEYEDLRTFSEGRCGICKIPEAGTRRGFLDVDHFHGKNGASFLRGMLCSWCNQSVMQCIDGLKAWGRHNRIWEPAAREYESRPWERPSEEALRQMAARTEMPRKTSSRLAMPAFASLQESSR
jgi:Recombination endonuclease VII